MSNKKRVATHAIDPQFIERWSPRAFTGEDIPEATLLGFIEAARWAPSAYNAQPWRFLYARRDSADWQRYLDLLVEANCGWAQHASALLVIVSKTTFVPPGKSEEQPAASHAFDTGAAWGFFALQAHLAGWHTHAMAGFDKELARRELKIPDGYEVHAMVAVGKRGDAASLPEALQARETPSPRLALEAIAAEGEFSL
ncbi:Nitroreductase [Geopseudomonas sagittaria]|uniref:Nitroreductase n=1 Tax=Geopseudomonas sagittaria TaxID=1135990 RepID=A0A1I5UUE2_9GAMM|nr:nitroreductase family protein [Pseudomonas sagittaria]SFP98808.1 Nitroreductase [Pseudomonas sagittaria]